MTGSIVYGAVDQCHQGRTRIITYIQYLVGSLLSTWKRAPRTSLPYLLKYPAVLHSSVRSTYTTLRERISAHTLLPDYWYVGTILLGTSLVS